MAILVDTSAPTPAVLNQLDYSKLDKAQVSKLIDRVKHDPETLPPNLKALWEKRAAAKEAARIAEAAWSAEIAKAVRDVPQGFAVRIWDRFDVTIATALPAVWARYDQLTGKKVARESMGIASQVRLA